MKISGLLSVLKTSRRVLFSEGACDAGCAAPIVFVFGAAVLMTIGLPRLLLCCLDSKKIKGLQAVALGVVLSADPSAHKISGH